MTLSILEAKKHQINIPRNIFSEKYIFQFEWRLWERNDAKMYKEKMKWFDAQWKTLDIVGEDMMNDYVCDILVELYIITPVLDIKKEIERRFSRHPIQDDKLELSLGYLHWIDVDDNDELLEFVEYIGVYENIYRFRVKHK